jgi:alpha-amylase
MFNIKSILFSVFALLSMSFSAYADNSYGLKSNIQDGVILHCFDWKLSDIKAALPDIAKAGFTAVQTSPVSKGGGAGAVWYDVYRPQDYTIGNGIGSESELKDLCTTAHQYGVKVIVDVVANHTDYPNCTGYMNDKSRYHTPFDVGNWNDRNQVTHGKIGMWDNKTEDSGVQNYIHQFIEALKNCGVDGIRWDAAKHIGLPSEGDSFWENVPDKDMYNYGEILDGTGGDDKTLFPEYQKYISITDNGYGNGFASSFNSGQVNSSIGNFNQRGATTAKLVYWGESHDTYANDGGSSKYMSQNIIDRAYAVVAGNNGATALYFSRPSSTDKNSMKLGQKGSTHFTSKEVAEVNHMHNICAGEPNYYVHKDNVAAQVRQSGAIIVLGKGSNQSVSFANGAGDGKCLKAGTYTDKVGGGTFTVTTSTISGQVGSTGIAVIYNGTVSTDPSVTLSPASGTSFSEETTTITATAENATSAWIQVDGGSKQTFTTTTTVTIGSGVDYGKSITISWGATGTDGKTASGSATYNKVKAYTPTLSSKDEVSCFLETASDNAKIWAWNTTVPQFTENKWPGDAMTFVGKAANGNNVFKWTYTGTESAPTKVILTHDGETRFVSENIDFKNHGYYVEGVWKKEITEVEGGEVVPSGKYVYFDNPNKWSNVYCYFYDGTTSASVWPGEKMTYDETVTHNGKTGWYKVSIPADFTYAKYVLNDGTGAQKLASTSLYTTQGTTLKGSAASSDKNAGTSGNNGGSSR